MATKAEAARRSLLVFSLSGSTRTVLFDCVRNWTVRFERAVIAATNNDSSGWRELVLPSTAAVNEAAGQRQWTIHAEAIYDMSTAGFGGITDRAQRHDRQQAMRALVQGTALVSLGLNVGSTVHTTPDGSWATLGGAASIQGWCESVEVGGTYDQPVLFGMQFRGNAEGIV